MAGENLQFNAPGSIFSKLNRNGEPGTISPPPTQVTSQIDTTSEINSSTTQTESMTDQKNAEYRSVREKEMVDPNVQANSEVDSNIKNPKPVDFKNTNDTDIKIKQGSLEPQPRSPDTEIIETKTSRQTSDTEQGWIERQAMSKINSWMSDAGSESKETKGEELKDPDTSTKKSKKTGVGKVPALDRTRPSTKIPNTNNGPNPKPPVVGNRPNPKISIPKFSMPKMKLR